MRTITDRTAVKLSILFLLSAVLLLVSCSTDRPVEAVSTSFNSVNPGGDLPTIDVTYVDEAFSLISTDWTRMLRISGYGTESDSNGVAFLNQLEAFTVDSVEIHTAGIYKWYELHMTYTMDSNNYYLSVELEGPQLQSYGDILAGDFPVEIYGVLWCNDNPPQEVTVTDSWTDSECPPTAYTIQTSYNSYNKDGYVIPMFTIDIHNAPRGYDYLNRIKFSLWFKWTFVTP